MDREILVKNIKIFCEKKGIKPTAACRESGAGRSFMSNLEGNGSIPSVEKIQLLANYLGVTTSELLGEEPRIADIPESELNEPLISKLVSLTPEEMEKVDAFVQGLIASRKA